VGAASPQVAGAQGGQGHDAAGAVPSGDVPLESAVLDRVIRLLAAEVAHYEGVQQGKPGEVLKRCGKQLIDFARTLSGVEHTRASLRIEAQKKERDLYLGKSDLELVSLVLAVPELRRMVLERVAIDAPDLVLEAARNKELAG